MTSPPLSGPVRFDGSDYDPAYDDDRLQKQLGRVWVAMRDGVWRTLAEIEELTGDPPASISAQLRHLRKKRFGGYIVEKRSRGDRAQGLYEYRVPGGKMIEVKNEDEDERLEVMDQVVSCERCELVQNCTAPVPFFGPAPAEIAIVGEAPGKQEDEQGQPFVGPAGQVIRDLLRKAKFDPDEIFWCNTVSCFPHGTPTTAHVEACKVNRDAQLVLAQPKWVLLLGKVALQGFRTDLEISKARGHPFAFDYPNKPVYFASYHPAAALRNRMYERALLEDLQTLRRMVDDGGMLPFIGNLCVQCEAFGWYTDSTGILWCRQHMPEEGHQIEAQIAADLAAARERQDA